MIELGVTAEDKVTGFRGTVTGKCQYLTGCNQVLLIPRVDKDGKCQDGAWFDEQRIVVDEAKPIIKTDNSKAKGFDMEAPKK